MNLRNRKILSLFLSLALVIGIMVGTVPSVGFAEEEALTLTILHTNDIHGHFVYDGGDRSPSIGHAKFKTLLDEKRAGGNVLLLDAGDVLHGTIDINLGTGKDMVELMNLLEVDVMVPGNHDFNYGYERLLELKGLADFEMIAANVIYEADQKPLFDAYTIKEYDGFKVGIFGIATEETKTKSLPANTVGIGFTDYMLAAKKAVADLQAEGVDLIIALTHVGDAGSSDITTIDIAKEVKGIDIIVDGHSHTTLEEGNLVGQTLIVQTGEYLENIGLVEVKLAEGKVVDKKASLFTTEDAADLESDEKVQAKIDKMLEVNVLIKEEVIGSSKVNLVGDREVVRTGESTLGNLMTDAMVHSLGADIAFTNGGGIRASIEAGDVTLGDALTAFPFTNLISTINVTGKELVAALEHGVKDYPDQSGGFPHVSGMTYEFDQSKPAGERVTKVLVDGKEVDLAKTYLLATNDFMATGGDGYTMFEGKTIINEGGIYSDALIAYFKEFGEVEPKVEGRIKVVGKAPVVEEDPVEASDKYTVVADDFLWKIAKKFNTTWEKLAEFNKLKDANLIFPGQVILIP